MIEREQSEAEAEEAGVATRTTIRIIETIGTSRGKKLQKLILGRKTGKRMKEKEAAFMKGTKKIATGMEEQGIEML